MAADVLHVAWLPTQRLTMSLQPKVPQDHRTGLCLLLGSGQPPYCVEDLYLDALHALYLPLVRKQLQNLPVLLGNGAKHCCLAVLSSLAFLEYTMQKAECVTRLLQPSFCTLLFGQSSPA